MNCKFCEEYEWSKQHKRKHPGGPEFYTTFHVCLYERTHRKGYGIAGTYTHRARPINYCPECGKKLRLKHM